MSYLISLYETGKYNFAELEAPFRIIRSPALQNQ
ncbi:hypothetical protein T4B_6918 [Trichinella pseudospiralis]|uniref:Uncharacterized protein n=1 Tax=Trichinella pseudospiralis TaxID=6337 RepID=A0A0V1GBI3_TRIPS|nr:hypothetical protein T4A_7363 [Trichinella pseudospiralis]KRY94578.1 hypothetical protein T4B_6918 [Trichinella pseudospiralis]KRY95609.1 hypothetical protein T4C_7547 [Trichinella pseudospiralis]